MEKNISFTLKVWRQKGPKAKGAFETYQMKDIPGDTSFLEMLDILNEDLINEGKEPICIDHDCREGICGMCSLYINGHPHGPANRCYHLSDVHASFRRRRHNHCWTLAFCRIPCYPWFDGWPHSVRQNYASRRICEYQYRCSSRCQCYIYIKGNSRRSDGFCFMYRLWCLLLLARMVRPCCSFRLR